MVSSRPVRYSKSRLPLHTDPWDRILGSRHAVHAAHGTTQTERQRRGDRTDMEHRQAEAATDKARMKSRLKGQASAADLQDVVLHGRHVAHAHPVLGCGAHHALQWEGHAWMGAPVEGTIWRLDGWGSVTHPVLGCRAHHALQKRRGTKGRLALHPRADCKINQNKAPMKCIQSSPHLQPPWTAWLLRQGCVQHSYHPLTVPSPPGPPQTEAAPRRRADRSRRRTARPADPSSCPAHSSVHGRER